MQSTYAVWPQIINDYEHFRKPDQLFIFAKLVKQCSFAGQLCLWLSIPEAKHT